MDANIPVDTGLEDNSKLYPLLYMETDFKKILHERSGEDNEQQCRLPEKPKKSSAGSSSSIVYSLAVAASGY